MSAIARPEQAERDEAPVTDSFRLAMSRLAAGIVMVTCYVDGKPWGLTVSACCSVSMSPPLILVSLGQGTASASAITDQRAFGVSVLGERLIDVARFGSSRGEPKFVEHLCAQAEDGACESPALDGAIAHVDCILEQRVPAGDHLIFIGRVCSVLLSEGDRPLVFHDCSYHHLAPSTDLHVRPVVDEAIDSLLYDYPLPRQFVRVRTAGADTREGTGPAEPDCGSAH